MYYFKFFIPFRFISCKIEEQFINHSFYLILKSEFVFLSVCDKFRSNEENERIFKGIIKNSVQISEFEFLKDLDLKGIFEFINYKYFKTAGFEFIFKEKPKGLYSSYTYKY